MYLSLLALLPLATAAVSVGSYGRIQVSSDLTGGEGSAVNVVSHGTRLEQDPYLEVDTSWSGEVDGGALFDIVVTPAVSGEPFHFDGTWDADLALRNMYVEARSFTRLPLAAWAGSRMVRGDDVYLLDFWPLDEINAVGGGLRLEPEGFEVAATVGLNRLVADEWQVQYLEVPDESGVGTESVLYLDRERVIGALRLAREVSNGESGFRVRLYGEYQGLPAATRIETDQDLTEVDLPADWGTVAGGQVSAWGWAPGSFVHVFLERSSGLAALGELTVPSDGLAPDDTVHDATEYLGALSANHQGSRAGVLVGGYLRRFDDADGVTSDPDDRWEAIVDLRPVLFIGRYGSLGLDLSHQWLRPDGLNPHTREADVPQITKIAVLPAIQPMPGTLARPQIRLQYVYSHLNDDARLWFDARDERWRSNHQHFLGVGAEWWINSRSYR